MYGDGFGIFGILLIVLAAAVLWSTVKVVPQGFNYTVESFGRFTRTFTGSTARPTLSQYLGGSFSNTDPVYKFDPASPLGTTTATTGGGDVAYLDNGLKLPTNMRGNLAADFKLPKLDATLTVEYIHTSVMEALFYNNANLVVGGQGADGRDYFRRYVSATNTNLVPLGTSGGIVGQGGHHQG